MLSALLGPINSDIPLIVHLRLSVSCSSLRPLLIIENGKVENTLILLYLPQIHNTKYSTKTRECGYSTCFKRNFSERGKKPF